MIKYSLADADKTVFGKVALLITVPCAIFPILFSTAGLMTIPFEPLIFENDFIIFLAIYLLYVYGLLLSWFRHKEWLPFFVFVAHTILMMLYIFSLQQTWLAYLSIFSIMGTSVANQYFRNGMLECNEC